MNLHLIELTNITGQKKEDIVFWIEGAANPADRLGKFDIDKDPVERWISLTNQVLFPAWLQQHPDKFLNKLISNSKRKISLQLQGGHVADQLNQKIPDTISVRYISCYEGYMPKHLVQGIVYDTSSLQNFIDRNRHKGSAYCMKIIRLATYAFHKWKNQVYLKKKKVGGHPY